jgi:hypothetical protein
MAPPAPDAAPIGGLMSRKEMTMSELRTTMTELGEAARRFWRRPIRQEGHPRRASPKARGPSRNCRFRLENLEDRSLLSTYTLWEATVPPMTVWEKIDNQPPVPFPNSPPTFGVNTGPGSNTVNILDTSAGVGIYVGVGGSDTVNVGNGGLVQGILAPVTIQNSSNFDTINVDDSADPFFHFVTLSNPVPGWGWITGLAPAPILYTYANTSSVHLTTGFGGDTVNVLATGDKGLATGVATYLSSNGGADTVNVGNGGTVQDILGDLYIENPPWFTTLNIDDSADPIAHTVQLSTITPGFDPVPWGSITGLAPAAISYEYADTSSVHLTTGFGGDTVNVLATGANGLPGGVATYLSSNGGADTVNVGNGGTVQDILGDLYIENPPWFTTLNIDDSADSTGHTYTLSTITPGWGSITGLAPASINFKWFDVNCPVTIWTSATVSHTVLPNAKFPTVPVIVWDNAIPINL